MTFEADPNPQKPVYASFLTYKSMWAPGLSLCAQNNMESSGPLASGCLKVIIFVKWKSSSDYTANCNWATMEGKKKSLEELENFIDECYAFHNREPKHCDANFQVKPTSSPGVLSPNGKFKDTRIYW